MKPSRLLVFFLLFAAPVQAQHCHSRMQVPLGNNSIGGGSQGIGGGYGSSINSGGSGNTGLQYDPPRDYTLGYAKNDGPFVPSTYMEYGEAIALGRQQLAAVELRARADANPPLGDIARAFKAARLLTPKPPVPGSPEQTRQAGGVQAAR
jgi:hypothetical protein